MQEQPYVSGVPLPEDGLESFPLEPSDFSTSFDVSSDDAGLGAFPDEDLPIKTAPTGCVVIEHKAPPPPSVQMPLVPIPDPQNPVCTATMWTRRAIVLVAALTAFVTPIALARGVAADRKAAQATGGAQVVVGLQADQPDVPVLPVDSRPLETPIPNATAAPADKKRETVAPIQNPATSTRAASAAPAPAISTPPPPKATPPEVTPTETPPPPPPPPPPPTLTPAVTPPPAPPPTAGLTPTSTSMAKPTPAVTPSAAAPTATSTPTPAPTPTRREMETAAIQGVVDRYRQAFGSLDASAIAAYWPTANVKGLTKAFEQLEAQTFTFSSCGIDITGEQAVASCAGTASFTPKVGSRTPRVESRHWVFRMARGSDRWIILSVESR